MKLDEFVSQSLSQIYSGMKKFQHAQAQSEEVEATETNGELIEGANVFPELSGGSGDIGGAKLYKAAQVDGFDGYGTIMAIDFEVLVSVENNVMGVVEGSVNGLMAKLKTSVQGDRNHTNSQRLSFTIPLELPLYSRKRAKPPLRPAGASSAVNTEPKRRRVHNRP